MRGERGGAVLFVLALLGACATSPVDGTAAAGGAQERGPTRALREAAREPDREPGPAQTVWPTTVELSTQPSDANEGEDGRGSLVPATNPVALDIRRTGGWPGRALDPALTIGDRTFRAYVHVDGEVLRYVVADVRSLSRDGVMYVQWGDDVESRLDVIGTLTTQPTGSLVP